MVNTSKYNLCDSEDCVHVHFRGDSNFVSLLSCWAVVVFYVRRTVAMAMGLAYGSVYFVSVCLSLTSAYKQDPASVLVL